ncbi:MAG: AmmeMemoRadiSam system protein B [Woeseiaceae bacterium]|nr:AmmeMemoRadiSam system protein B [Woeseiaceae bacterium]
MVAIREAAVAGQFYPAGRERLSRTVNSLLDEAGAVDAAAPKALIVPHAGYIYSGPVAASAYARLRPHRHLYHRVILLGPCHRVPVHGFALSGADVFRTPLGDVPVDASVIGQIRANDVNVFDETHRFEHSLEVHLPFLQTVLDAFTLVPIVVGDATSDRVAAVLEQLWGGPETLIVVSSDLSHYLDDASARRKDSATCAAIESFDAASIGHDSACGATPVGGLLVAAARRGMSVHTLDLRNSGDTAGDGNQVVGYGAWEFRE